MTRGAWILSVGPLRYAAVLAAILVPAAVEAGQVKDCKVHAAEGSRPTIRVKSVDGESYQAVETSNLEFEVSVIAGCNFASADRDVQIRIGQTTDGLHGFWDGVAKGFTEAKYKTVSTPYMSPNIGTSPVSACNLRLQELVAGGKPSWRAMREGFSIDRAGAYQAKLTVRCGSVIQDSETSSANFPVRIHCMPSALAEEPQRIPPPPPPPEPARRNTPVPHAIPAHPAGLLGGKIGSISLDVERSSYKGQCPMPVRFRARIVPLAPVRLVWQIVGDDGYESPAHPLNVTTSTPKNPTWVRTVDSPGAPGRLTAANSSRPILHGWARLRIRDAENPAAGEATSEKVSYTVDCNPADPRRRLR